MHKAALVAIAACLLVPIAWAQPPIEVRFSLPAQVGDEVQAANATWALIVFNDGEACFDADFPASSAELNVTLLSLLKLYDPLLVGGSRVHEVPVESTRTQDPFKATVCFAGIASLYLHGANLQLHVSGTRADLISQDADDCLDTPFRTPERERQEARYFYLCPEESAAALIRPVQDSIDIQVKASGLDVVEWHHAQLDCEQGPCPDGGQRRDETVTTPRATATNSVRGYHQFTTQGANIAGHGRASRIIVGGPSFDLGVSGWVRLPLATSTAACDSCVTADNRTFYAEGNLELADLRQDGDNLAAGMHGTFTAVRFDETPSSPSELVAVSLATAAGIGIAAGLVYLFRLYTRQDHRELTQKRNMVLEAIQARPGANAYDLVVAAGVPRNTLRHHLKALVNGGHIVEYRDGEIVCYFENHGRYGDEWQQRIAVLRKKVERQLYDWILANPGQRTADVVAHAHTQWGWRHSTTDWRLQKLLKVGLVVREPNTRAGTLRAEPIEIPTAAAPATTPVASQQPTPESA